MYRAMKKSAGVKQWFHGLKVEKRRFVFRCYRECRAYYARTPFDFYALARDMGVPIKEDGRSEVQGDPMEEDKQPAVACPSTEEDSIEEDEQPAVACPSTEEDPIEEDEQPAAA